MKPKKIDSKKFASIENCNLYYNSLKNIEVKKYKEAIKDLSLFIEKENANANAYFYRGLSEYFTGMYEEAMKDFSEAFKISSSNKVYNYKKKDESNYICNNSKEKSYYDKGWDFYYLGKYKEAIEAFSKAIENTI